MKGESFNSFKGIKSPTIHLIYSTSLISTSCVVGRGTDCRLECPSYSRVEKEHSKEGELKFLTPLSSKTNKVYRCLCIEQGEER